MTDSPLVVIVSSAHAPRMRAHRVLSEAGYVNWMMVVDDHIRRESAVAAGVDPSRICVAGTPGDVPRQDRVAWCREWAEEYLVDRDEWYVSLDDNVAGWTGLPEPFYSMDSINLAMSPSEIDPKTRSDVSWRELYATPCSLDRALGIWVEMIERCERLGTFAGGLAVEENHYFRSRKWQTLGYVRAQNAVWKNVGLPFYYWRGAMLEDFVRSVDIVARVGSVLVNRFVKPVKPHFEEGGIGSLDERRPQLTACCDELTRRYPGLLRRVKGRDYSLTFAPRSLVDTWRRSRR